MRYLQLLLLASFVAASTIAAAPALAAAPQEVLHLGPGMDEPLRITLPSELTATSVATLGGSVVVAGELEGGGISLVVGGMDKVLREVPSPPTGADPRTPVAISDGQTLLALGWLAGGQRHADVEAAAWNGERWERTTLIAPGSRTQLALSGAATADGRAVIAWSAYDGEDDEILWSRHDSAGWSAPRRVGADDQVPDIVPALGRVGGELHLAWSEWDGDAYRLRLARLEGDQWRVIATLPERGAFAARFESDGVLSYRDGEGAAWVVRELAGDGSTARLSKSAGPGDADARPRVLGTGGGALWLDRDGELHGVDWQQP